jgi:hypothetical protein
MTATTAAFAAGLFNLGFAVFHLAFWRLFGWPERLAALDRVNRVLPPVMNICLILLFAGLGIAIFGAPHQAAATGLGRSLMGALTVFWLARTILQPLYFGLTHPASMVLFVIFAAGAALHALVLALPIAG